MPPPGMVPPKAVKPKPIPLGAQPGQPGWKARTEKRWARNNQPQIKAAAAARAKAAAAPAGPVVDTSPEGQAMTTFRSTLAQLNALTPEVDALAIRKPYEESKVATGQLGEGWRQASVAGGQAAQSQFNTARDDAQSSAARFGISAGAGGANMAIDTSKGDLLLAQQTQANQAAAVAAAAAWQGLLERTAGGAVSKAQSDRQGVIDTGKRDLALSIPGMVNQEKDRAFQQGVANDNRNIALSQLTEKQRASMTAEDLRKYGIDVAADTAAAGRRTTERGQDKTYEAAFARATETNRHNLKTEAATLAKQKAAAKAGIKGLSDVMKLNPKAGAEVNTPTGFYAMYKPINAQGEVTGPAQRIAIDRKDAELSGYRLVRGSSTTRYQKLPSEKSGFNWGTYRQQIAILVAANPGMTPQQAAKYLTPTPKTGKKK